MFVLQDYIDNNRSLLATLKKSCPYTFGDVFFKY